MIHLWLGLLSGLVVFIVSLTGCIFVFEEELFDLIHRDMVYVEHASPQSVLPLNVLRDSAQKRLGKVVSINSVNIYPQADRAYVFDAFLNDKSKADNSFWDHAGLTWKRVYVNPYNGSSSAVLDMQYEFFITVRSIHQNLFIRSDIGSPIVGTATIIFMILLLSGLVLWWPKNKAAANQRFSFKWKSTTQWKRKNYDLHNIPGFYVLVIGLFIGLTGIVWSFKWWENTVYRMLDGEIIKFELAQNPNQDSQTLNKDILTKVFDQVKNDNPDYLRIYLSESLESNTLMAAVNFKGQDLWTSYNYYQYDLSTGKEFSRLLQDQKTTGQKWRNSNYDLHTGKTLGLAGQCLAFIASLICASLPVTGFLIWLKRKGKNKDRKRVKQTSVVKRL